MTTAAAAPISSAPIYPSSYKSRSKHHHHKSSKHHKKPEATSTSACATATEAAEQTITVTTTVYEDIYVDCSVDKKGNTVCTTASTDYDGTYLYLWLYTNANGEDGSYATGYAQATSGPYAYGYKYGKL